MSPVFVTSSSGMQRIFIDYKSRNAFLAEETFGMERLTDVSPFLRQGNHLFKAAFEYSYYHLRLRNENKVRMVFTVVGRTYVKLCRNCGLAVTPWFFMKSMHPVVEYLRERGHRMFAYLGDFFGADTTNNVKKPASTSDTASAEVYLSHLFARLSHFLNPTKTYFSGPAPLKILGIMVDNERPEFSLSTGKLGRVELRAKLLLRYA